MNHKSQYKVKLTLLYTSILAPAGVHLFAPLPNYVIDYKMPLLLLWIVIVLFLSYIILLKEKHREKLELLEISDAETAIQDFIKIKNYIDTGFIYDSKCDIYRDKDNKHPYCKTCLEKMKLSRLKEVDDFFYCSHCNTRFFKEKSTSTTKTKIRKSGLDLSRY